MAESYIQMFEEKFYPPIFLEMAEKTIQHFTEQEEQIAEEGKKKLNQHLKQIILLQKEQKIEPIQEINVSFLYTSMDEKTAKFRIDSYEAGGRIWKESIVTTYLCADWMVSGLKDMVAKFKECAEKESLRRYIRPAELEVLKLRAVRSLLYYFASRFRYTIQDMLDLQKLAKVKKMESFVIQMGEYMDWQRTIFASLPEVDIFNCDKETGLRFRHFPAIYYQKKEFLNLKLSQSKFEDCTFHAVLIDGCDMNDCIFDGCNFENVTIQNTQLAAGLFFNCTLKQVKFHNVVFSGKTIDGHEGEYFALPEFHRCLFQESEFHHCRFPNCITEDCEVAGLVIENCDAENSGFFDLDSIVWRQDSQEE